MGSLDIAKEGYDAFSRGDMAKFMSLCDDNIEWTVLRHHLLHHAGIRDIELYSHRPHLPGQLRRSGQIEIGDDHMSPGAGKAPHDRRADAVRPTRDESTAAVEPPK